MDTFIVNTPYKDIHFHRSQRVLYYHDFTPGKCALSMVHTFKVNGEGFTNLKVADSSKAQQAYDMVSHP